MDAIDLSDVGVALPPDTRTTERARISNSLGRESRSATTSRPSPEPGWRA
jgi:hypothetical protein